ARGPDGIGGAQDAGDEPRLPPDLSDEPAGERRHPAGEGEAGEDPEQPARRRAYFPTQPVLASPRDEQHQDAHADHRAEGEEYRRDRRMVLELVEPPDFGIRVVREDQGARLRQHERVVGAALLLVRYADQRERDAALGMP